MIADSSIGEFCTELSLVASRHQRVIFGDQLGEATKLSEQPLRNSLVVGSSVPDAPRQSGLIPILCRMRMCNEMPNRYPIGTGILMSEESIALRLIPHRWRCCFCRSVLTSDLMRNSRFTVDSHCFSAQAVDLRELHIRSSCKTVQQICSGAGSDLKQAKTR